MLFINIYVNVVIILYFYMLMYNFTLSGILWILKSVNNSKFKTLYSFNSFYFDSFYLFFLTIFLFSLAGVPPFIGFFNKLFLLDLLIHYNFFVLYFVFFVILILGLYFYMQNLRFLHSTNYNTSTKIFLNNDKVIITLYYYLIFQSIFLLNGAFLIDDLVLSLNWIIV